MSNGETLDQLNRRFGGVRTESQVADLTLLAGSLKDLHGAAGPKDLIHLFHLCHTMKLVQIEAVGSKALQRPVQFLLNPGGVAPACLAREEQLVAAPFKCWTKFLLRVAVGGTEVEVVDAPIYRISDQAVSLRFAAYF